MGKMSVLWASEIYKWSSPNCVKIHFYLFITDIFEFMAVFPIKMLNSHKDFLEAVLRQNVLSS